jgi:hypothetical protein
MVGRVEPLPQLERLVLTAMRLERRGEPLRNLLRPDDDAILRDLGIVPPACNYSSALEAWRLQRFAITGTFEIGREGDV